MRELNVNQIEQVNGGWLLQFAASYAAGHALDWAISQDWGTSMYSWDTNIAA